MKRQIQDDALYNDDKEENSELSIKKDMLKFAGATLGCGLWVCFVFFVICIVLSICAKIAQFIRDL